MQVGRKLSHEQNRLMRTKENPAPGKTSLFYSYVKSHLDNDSCLPIYKTIPAIIIPFFCDDDGVVVAATAATAAVSAVVVVIAAVTVAVAIDIDTAVLPLPTYRRQHRRRCHCCLRLAPPLLPPPPPSPRTAFPRLLMPLKG